MTSPLAGVTLGIVDSWDAAVEFMAWLSRGNRDRLAVDTETTGLRLNNGDRARLVQVGWIDGAWSIPWHNYRGLFEEVVRRFTGRYVMHNAKFDWTALANEGSEVTIPRHRIDDTAIMSHLAEPNLSRALKPQASRHVDAAAAGASRLLDAAMAEAGWTWGTVPWWFEPYWQYAALDTVLTAFLDEHHRPTIEAQCPSAYDLELAVQWVILDMERRGVHVDRDFARDAEKRFLDEANELSRSVKSEFDCSIGSIPQLVQRFQEDGVELWQRTEKGAFQLTAEVLRGLDHPLAPMVLRYRRLGKLASTYLRHFAEDADANDLLHPSINTLGARTGRMSMDTPNLQNLPRRSDSNPDANTVRNAITSRYGDDGGTLLMCDFDQIEMRMLAHMSGDAGLRAAFASPNDFFVELAQAIYRDPHLIKSDPRRSLTKNVGYAQIYGAGLAKLALTAGVSIDQVEVVKQRFDQLYPSVKRFQRQVEDRAWARSRAGGEPYVLSPVTGRHHVADRGKVYALVNYLIQGTAAEIFKQAILRLDAAGFGEYMMIPVHDEIVLDVPADVRDDAVKALRETMNDFETFRVPITASVAAGVRWGEKQEVSDG